MKSIPKIVMVISALLLMKSSFSQEEEYVEVSDFESWTSLELGYKPTKKWSFSLQEQLRLDNNSSEVKGYFTELSSGYKLFKSFELAMGFRYITRNDNEGKVQGNRNYFRYQIDASFSHDVSNFSIKYRLRYHTRNELGLSVADGDYPDEFIRLLAKVEYNIKGWKFDPEVSGELFDYIEKGVNKGLVGYRLTFGTSFKVHKGGKMGVYYRIEEELNTDYPKTNYILRLKYAYTFKNKK